MNKDLTTLNELIDNAMDKESELQIRSEKLALQSREFADYLAAKKHADEELEVLWQLVKDFMIDNNINEHATDYIELKLTPSGKYKAEDIESVDDSLCDIKKILNNKKVKAYQLVNGKLPDGITATGMILRKKLLNVEKE